MRRIVRRALSWRPEAVLLRRLWARMRASWWHGWGLDGAAPGGEERVR